MSIQFLKTIPVLSQTMPSFKHYPYALIVFMFFLLLHLYLHVHLTHRHSLSSYPHPPFVPFTPVSIPSSSNITSQRIAVCLTGQLRTFPHPSVHNSILLNLILPLRNANYHVDLFFNVDLPTPSTRYTINSLLCKLHPIHIAYFDHTTYPPQPTNCPNPHREISHSTATPLLRSFQCLQLIRRHELRIAATYHWIYKTRPDIALASRLSLPSHLRTDTLYMNRHNPGTSVHAHSWLRARFAHKGGAVVREPVGDHILVAARGVAEVGLSAVLVFAECGLYELPEGTLNSEVGLTYWLAKWGLRYRTKSWFWILVRAGGVDCFRVKWIAKGDRERAEMMRWCLQFNESGELNIQNLSEMIAV